MGSPRYRRRGGVFKHDIAKHLKVNGLRLKQLMERAGVADVKRGEPLTMEQARRVIYRFWFERR